jgi:hypothetical protein
LRAGLCCLFADEVKLGRGCHARCPEIAMRGW